VSALAVRNNAVSASVCRRVGGPFPGDSHREWRSSRINRVLSENGRPPSRWLHRSDNCPASFMVSMPAARSRIALTSRWSERPLKRARAFRRSMVFGQGLARGSSPSGSPHALLNTLASLGSAQRWLPCGCHSDRICGGLRDSRTRRAPQNASKCREMFWCLTSQGRNIFPIRFAPRVQKYPGFIGTRARSVVAPRGYVGWWENRSALKFKDLQLPGSARSPRGTAKEDSSSPPSHLG
jgi:hypothetical protein